MPILTGITFAFILELRQKSKPLVYTRGFTTNRSFSLGVSFT
ncbi:hypothetical protein SAMN05216311_104165 [Chitinophaga sp. CF418]|nr:hypothetical protein SAMN05216311_104165 [Chitinophaga sp. CF418]